MDDLLEITQYAQPRFDLILPSAFASVGLILAVSAVIAILMMVGLFASYWPSRRAAQVDPAICLCAE